MQAKKNRQKLSIFLIVTSCLLYILLIHATLDATAQYSKLQEFTNTFIACQSADAQLAAGSDYLTEQARMYVVTQNEQNLQNYFAEADETRRRERAINQLAAYQAKNAAYDYLMDALDASNLLMQREFYAMKLTALSQEMAEEDLPASLQNTIITVEDLQLSPQEMLIKAQDLVFNERYTLSKNMISADLELAISSLLDNTRQEQHNAQQKLQSIMNRQCIFICLLFAENVLLLILLLRRRQHKPAQPSK